MFRRWAALLGLTLGIGGVAFWTGCDTGPIVQEARHFTSTVTLSSEASLILDMPIGFEIDAAPVRTSVLVDFNGAVTASTSSKAKSLAAALDFVVTRPDAQTVKISLPAPATGSRYLGAVHVFAPPTLKLTAGSLGSIIIKSWTSEINAAAVGGVEIDGGCCAITISQCTAAVVTTSLQAAQPVNISSSGEIDLFLPARPSIALNAEVADVSQLSIEHPAFPRPVGGLAYTPILNGGLAPVHVLTQAGRIVIRSSGQ
ncbi:MAG: hypothetical protein U1E65_10170 [Myxococcota bacterium]